MANFPNIILTIAGLNMITQSNKGIPLIFTRMKLGSGELTEEDDIQSFTDVKNFKLEVPLHSITPIEDGQVKLRFSLANVSVPKGFFLREVGVFAKVGEEGMEQLYSYTNAGSLTDYLGTSDLPINELFDIDTIVGNAKVLNLTIKSEINATLKDLEDHNENSKAHVNSSVPVGTIIYHAAQTPPAGYLKCNGLAVSRVFYAELFNTIGTIYGEGDEATTFNLPDLRGEFVRGWDDERGVDIDRKLGSEQKASYINWYLGHSYNNSLVVSVGESDSSFNYSISGSRNAPGKFNGTDTYIANTVRPRNIAMLACIKY